MGWSFFLQFWNVLVFLQNPLAWFSKLYLRVQSKISGRNSFLILLFGVFFRILRETFFRLSTKKLQEVVKSTSARPEEQFVAWNFFLKFWIVLGFLQKPLAWFSKFYLRVQSENSRRSSFLFFSSEFSRILSKNFFTFLAKKLQEVFKTTFYVSRGTVCGLNFFLKFWTVLGFLQNSLAWFSNFYLRVQIKNSGRKNFLFFFSYFFRILSEKFIRVLAKKLQEVFKTTLYVSRGTVCGLSLFFKL